MTKEAIYKKLAEIFCDVFDDESLSIDETTASADIPGWDSLQQINLILAVETEFGIKFAVNEMSQLSVVGNIVDSVQKKLGNL